ncbi:hypothetical protein PAXINDRAFT_19328 [Paxillus involutus ATCC 200175]|uniref:Uncharacterized protein n=1 Tax=Paxillus involutus ATCC 200175 TaxID=664439 RepID=A0A0C9TJG7_PAXIN|nr:hypothetical protein PAXINDRAFT_19328 [Paxillus involutus ATCC 200175]
MSTLFIAARYLGLALAMYVAIILMFSTGRLLTGRISGNGLCVGMIQFLVWGGFIYFAVTNAIMIFRVAVMFNHPKRTTYMLSFLYLLVIIEAFIINFLSAGLYSGITISSVTLVDDTLCEIQRGRSIMLAIYGGIPGGLFDLIILALSVYRFAVHSIETKKRLGRTKVNVYMRLLFDHSVLYFVLNLASKALDDGTGFSSSTWYVALANLYGSTVPYVPFPRLVLSFKGHRSESSGLYVASPPQHPHPHSHSHSHSASSGGPRSEEFESIDVNSPAGRLPQSSLDSTKGGMELV